jgi:hypothetical protein
MRAFITIRYYNCSKSLLYQNGKACLFNPNLHCLILIPYSHNSDPPYSVSRNLSSRHPTPDHHEGPGAEGTNGK